MAGTYGVHGVNTVWGGDVLCTGWEMGLFHPNTGGRKYGTSNKLDAEFPRARRVGLTLPGVRLKYDGVVAPDVTAWYVAINATTGWSPVPHVPVAAIPVVAARIWYMARAASPSPVLSTCAAALVHDPEAARVAAPVFPVAPIPIANCVADARVAVAFDVNVEPVVDWCVDVLSNENVAPAPGVAVMTYAMQKFPPPAAGVTVTVVTPATGDKQEKHARRLDGPEN